MQTASTAYGTVPPQTLGVERWYISYHYVDWSQEMKRLILPTPVRQEKAGLISQSQQ